VFLGENNSVKLGDFGLSKIIASHDFASTYVGTPFYMSPEICAAERYSHFSDIWSLGCIIYELATRQVPFEARTHMELIMKIKKGVIKPLPPQYSQDLTDAIAWCLKVDPRGRPDTSQLLSMANIKVSRVRSECTALLAHAEKERVKQAQLVAELQNEVTKLRDTSKRVEMEWHARATLAIDQKVYEAVEKRKAELLAEFEGVVEKRAEEKLNKHLASLPSQPAAPSAHVRSSTPPPGKDSAAIASFTTRGSSFGTTDASSFGEAADDSFIEAELTSLSLKEVIDEENDENSPLARRFKPALKKGTRKPFTRAKTFAYNTANHDLAGSPMDVHMADPSPMRNNVKGLSLSPRRNGQQPQQMPLYGGPIKRNIFSLATEKENRQPVRGRTLVELSLSSPAKWNPTVHGEDMPSPFLRRNKC
jgi:NIMA (never in mitosis gene a)-related kinase